MSELPPPATPVLVQRDELPLPGPYVPPKTPTETLLAAIWCEVLAMDRVGTEDRFQDLGGDSLHASMIFALLENQLHRPVPISILANAATVAALAQRIDELTGAAA